MMNYYNKTYDIIVVGAGHAGCEAALVPREFCEARVSVYAVFASAPCTTLAHDSSMQLEPEGGGTKM